jgi:hypothetical protein
MVTSAVGSDRTPSSSSVSSHRSPSARHLRKNGFRRCSSYQPPEDHSSVRQQTEKSSGMNPTPPTPLYIPQEPLRVHCAAQVEQLPVSQKTHLGFLRAEIAPGVIPES